MRLTRRAMLRDLGVLEARLRTAEAEVVSLRLRVANLLAQKAPSYDERIRLARRAEDAEAKAERWQYAAERALAMVSDAAKRATGPDFPRSIP